MLFNETKIILDLCGGTGAWSKPYENAGYDVRLITLPKNNIIDYVPPKENVYGVLAAPPCTEFSMARNRWPDIPRDFIMGMSPVNACIRIIFQCNPVFWALENPVGLLSRFLGKPKYVFEPWWFDEPYSKRTALWGRFKKPSPKYSEYKENPKACSLHIKAKKVYATRKSGIPSISDITSGNEKEKRAITPAGFAQAFFEVNQ